jgi:hypothetical protein
MHGVEVRQCRYIALSYVWGETNDFTLNSENISSFVKPGGLNSHFSNDLPRTIRDAIIVTREIGERYLWIDSMCIQQDDIPEKREQIELMDWVYGHATLTIVAADAAHAESEQAHTLRTSSGPQILYRRATYTSLISLIESFAASFLNASPFMNPCT